MLENYQIERLNFIQEILPYFGDNFILKGGTALRLYYALDRYSEDLDFDCKTNNMDITKKLKNHKDFNKWKIYTKKNTDSSYRITIDYGGISHFGIYPLGIDISGRNKQRLHDNELKYSNINGVNVYDIEVIIDMKCTTFLMRNKIRDFYDIGFLLNKYPQFFDKKTLESIIDKIFYTGAEELNLLLMDEMQNHKLVADNDISIAYDYAEKILEKIERIKKEIISTNRTIFEQMDAENKAFFKENENLGEKIDNLGGDKAKIKKPPRL